MKIRDNFDFYFFDFFGTVMLRDCSADDIKRIWAKHVSYSLSLKVSEYELYRIRKSSEIKVSKENPNMEFQYSDVIEEIYNRIIRKELSHISFDEFLQKAINIEKQIEKSHQMINTKILKSISALKEAGKKVYVLSDFYLNSDIIREFLSDKNYAVDFDGIFVSCDFGENKSQGGLYKLISERLGIAPSSALMVGDNLRSDYLNAKKNGFSAVKISSKDEEALTIDNGNCLKQYFSKERRNAYSYSNYAFTLFLFIKKLYDNLIEKGNNKVFFFAREGEFLKKLFDEFCVVASEKYNLPVINSEYLYVSRQSTYAATLNTLGEESFSVLFNQYPDMSIKTFLENLSITDTEIADIAKNLDFPVGEAIKELKNSVQFAALMESDTFIQIYEKNVESIKDILNKYLGQKGFFDCDTAAVVDVGWKGSIQNNIFKAVGGSVKIEGYYYGLLNESTVTQQNNKTGLIFSGYPYESCDYDIWSFDCNFFERLLSASHPSTKAYEKVNDEIVPIFNEFDSEKGNYELIAPIQEKITEKFKSIAHKYFDLPAFDNSIYRIIRDIHLDTSCNINGSNMILQTKLLSGQKENFGYQSNSSSLFKEKTSFSYLKKNAFSILKKLRSPILVCRVLNSKRLYGISALIYRAQKSRLKK